ncbi:MAG: glutamine-hydrolyzing GMP synthase [Ruminococcus sp.]|jgi:GMP synthase (glutamine-hydrolysing)|nr:glutamine-hydrolyzing GMP synthase [Ruminococcus sp.]
MQNNEIVLIIDFGGQYNQLIARRVRECNVYCEVLPFKTPVSEILARNPIGIIFTGGPASVTDSGAPMISKEIFEAGIPVLGICYGCQLLSFMLGGEVTAGEKEYGNTPVTYKKSPLFEGIPDGISWMSHTYYVSKPAPGFDIIAETAHCSAAAVANVSRKIYGVQFHPEVNHTENGTKIIRNFLYNICCSHGDWTMSDYMETAADAIRKTVGDGKVLLALSGGVDSSVAAALLSKAVGGKLTCVFVDHGMMRKNEGDEVEAAFADMDLNFVRVNAEDRFLEKLKGITEPEEKRKLIGEEFIRVFEEEAHKIGFVDFLAQGTIYPDVIESGLGDAAVIKSHHNVGGIPDCVDFREIIEPLRLLFKDEVRTLGRELGLSEVLVSRQPFPGPGLAIRIIGEITKEKLDILRAADKILRDELLPLAGGVTAEDNQSPLRGERVEITERLPSRNNCRLGRLGQYFAVLTSSKTVGVMGDERTYAYTVALRAVETSDFMTADFAKIPYETLGHISSRIVNEVGGINRVVYDITTKPPATIEWE